MIWNNLDNRVGF